MPLSVFQYFKCCTILAKHTVCICKTDTIDNYVNPSFYFMLSRIMVNKIYEQYISDIISNKINRYKKVGKPHKKHYYLWALSSRGGYGGCVQFCIFWGWFCNIYGNSWKNIFGVEKHEIFIMTSFPIWIECGNWDLVPSTTIHFPIIRPEEKKLPHRVMEGSMQIQTMSTDNKKNLL